MTIFDFADALRKVDARLIANASYHNQSGEIGYLGSFSFEGRWYQYGVPHATEPVSPVVVADAISRGNVQRVDELKFEATIWDEGQCYTLWSRPT
jgi:hypothetical protein